MTDIVSSKTSPASAASLSSPNRKRFSFGLKAVAAVFAVGVLFQASSALAEELAKDVVVYKDPNCQCCGSWANHMKQNGFNVTVINKEDMDPIKRMAGIPEDLQSCHTAFVGDYWVEGHVPASDITRMLTERPAIKGLTVPGMPMSAPGMDSPENEPYTVLTLDNEGEGKTTVYAAH